MSQDFHPKEIVNISNRIRCQYAFQESLTKVQPKPYISPQNIHFVTQLRLSVVSRDFDQKEIVDISNRIKCQYTFQDYCSTEAQPKYHIPPQNIDFKT